ncbi:MAG: acyl-CoA dehydrogenase [Planctomycetota bacterium]|jgi:acyl-CoA dehydrogenase
MLDWLIDEVNDFAAGAAPSLVGLDERAAAHAALALLADEGLLAWTVPHRDGGADAGELSAPDLVSVRALCRIRDELAYHSAMLDVMFVMQGLGSFPVALGGTPELRAELLPAVARGELIAAFALTEPEAGSNVAQVATKAEESDLGWSLTGEKTFISNAGIADFYSVLARTSGEVGDAKGLSMFAVPAGLAGLTVEPFEVMSPHPIGTLHFDHVEITKGQLLGQLGNGLDLAFGTLSRFRTSVAAAANGFSRRALDESCARLSQREQFGRPLATFQALRFDLAEMSTRLRAAQLLVTEAANAVDLDEDSELPVARAKLYATETAGYICDRAVQHFGGLGVKCGSVVEHLYRDVRALRIYEGTSEIQKLIIAKGLLKAEQ